MTQKQKDLHAQAMEIGSNKMRADFKVIRVLQNIESDRLFRAAGCRSLFKYAVKFINLSDPVALTFIAVARKARKIPELQRELKAGTICVSRASRIVSVMDSANAAELIAFAANHTWRQTETEVAKRDPRSLAPDRVKILSEKWAQLSMSIPVEVLADFERATTVEAQRRDSSPTFGEVLNACVQEYLDRRDPVRRAERAQKKKQTDGKDQDLPAATQLAPESGNYKRVPITAEERHAVWARDGGLCTHVGEDGKRCNEGRWVHLHHIIPASEGGTNHPDNLRTLCSFHHDLIHQLSLPLEEVG